jgi:DnaK suppressor protein|tara:strand:- start:683 stop:1015 length:333 start_codon:yes stop_codon:yes gene_type:complete
MDKGQLKSVIKKLNNEIKITKNKIAEYTEICKPIAPENSIGRISRMDAINNKSVVEAVLREAKNKMNQLKIMQNKIKSTDFGSCIKCKKHIPFERLMIRPHSTFCVNCAQ